MLQRIKMKTVTIGRYQQKLSQFQQNRLFRNIEGKFYKQTVGSEEGEEIVMSDTQEGNTFWTSIWGQEVEHNKDATWLRKLRKI